ncbi:MAG TPA: response regulator [Methanospirillum sp.]|nr:response regulator [Methanospirillum sp.]
MEKVRVLVVEDEFLTGREIQARLQDLGYDVPIVVDTGKEAIAKVSEIHPKVVIMDITLKGEMDGIEAAEQIRKQFGIPVIYLTAHSDDATVADAITTEPFGYLIKPLEERALVTSIRMALYKHSLDQALKEGERRYRAIAELAEDAIFIIDLNRNIVFLNRYAGQSFQCKPEDAVGKVFGTIITSSIMDGLSNLIDSVFLSGESCRETLSGTKDDIPVWFDTTLVPVFTDEGRTIQVIGLSRDITSLILFEKEIEKKGIKQIEQNMEQFQILNDKIRNPLAIIISYASLEKTKHNDIIVEQARKINDLVTQLDQGWIESATVRAFLLKHYGHGREL